MTENMNSEKKIREFNIEDTQCVKGIAILLLLYYHLFHDVNVVQQFGVKFFIPETVTKMLVGYGNICVAVFLFLSAYGMTKKLLAGKESIGKRYCYSVKRLLVLILHFVLMFISVNALWFWKFDYASAYGAGKQGILFLLTDALGLAQIFGTPTLCETWWYMEIAIICIVIMPLLVKAVEKLNWKLLVIALVLPVILTLPKDFLRYYLVMVLGCVAAEGNWLEKLHAGRVPKWARVLICLVLLAFSVILRQNYMVFETFAYVLDAPIALLIVYAVYEMVPGKSIPGRVVGFLGKHSMNIYFVHTFFYMILWRDYIYKPKYGILIYLCLVAVSLVYSVLLELIKKLIQVPRLIKLIDKLYEKMIKQQES